MKRLIYTSAALAGVFALMPEVSEAHVYGAYGAGFSEGLVHPFGGLDHVLAMLAVGLWAAQSGGRSIWSNPLAFVAMMTMGALTGVAGISIPFAEAGVAASVIVLGSLVALSAKWPAAAGMLLAGFFAIFHGHSHGAEMPQAASAISYGLGFVLATSLLHGAGIAAAMGLSSYGNFSGWLVRVGGGAIAAYGLMILTGI